MTMTTSRERVHNLKTVLNDFRILKKLIEEGYPLSSQQIQEILPQLDHALHLLELEITRTEKSKT